MNPRYTGLLKILARIGPAAYKPQLPPKLSKVHPIFHVSKLKKYFFEETLVVPLDRIKVNQGLHFIEELVKIMDRDVKQMKQCRIPIVKVRWSFKHGLEFTWERED